MKKPSTKRAAPKQAAPKATSEASGSELETFFRDRAGLRLPAHVFTFWKFWTGLAAADRKAVEKALGIEAVFGAFEFFDAKRPGKVSRLRADPRTHAWNTDCPPEMVSFLSGGDGPVIYGLWFDDPESGRAFVVRYRRGAAALRVVGGSLFEALDDAYESTLAGRSYLDDDDDGGLERARRVIASAKSLRKGIPPAPKSTGKDRVPTLSGVGVVSPDATSIAAARRKAIDRGLGDELRKKTVVAARKAAALRACAAGKPGEALALGHDLLWCGNTAAASPLFVASYAALGRPGLAAIAKARAKGR